MLKLAIIICCLAVTAASFLNGTLDFQWSLFKSSYNKIYKSQEEEKFRRATWEDNAQYIAKHNIEYDLGLHTFTVGINEFADMTNKEFVSVMNGLRVKATSSPDTYFSAPHNVSVPDLVDWRKKGYVTGVKSQGQCGSCYAFSSVAAIEGQHYKATGNLISLSEQNIIDCSTAEGNQGCNGGLMNNAFRYVIKNKGIDTVASYPYMEDKGKCRYNVTNRGATIRKYVGIKSGDEIGLKSAVALVGPVSVGIDASLDSFQFYRSGVYRDKACSSTNLDHAVLVVGYGTTKKGKDYWLVKNSWGTSWGKDGYARMIRNKRNRCGIATTASYPIV